MKDGKDYSDREKAEKFLSDHPDLRVLILEKYLEQTTITQDEIKELIHELKVYHVELEMQKEELIKNQIELEVSRNKYANLFDLAPIGYIILSDIGEILEVNFTALALLQDQRHLVLGNSIYRIIQYEDHEKFNLFLKRVLQNKIIELFECKLRRRDGTNFDAQLYCTVIKQTNLPSEEFRIAFMDVTQQKKIEENLVKSQKLESIGMLAGGIAHDFNNYLQSILNTINLIHENMLSGESKFSDNENLIFRVEKTINLARDLTNQLLIFSKGGKPVKRKVAVEVIIPEFVKFALHGSNCVAEFTIDPKIYSVEIDELQMKQVILNLILNARQAMPTGGTINVVIKNHQILDNEHDYAQPGKYVLISIEDHGIGIPDKIKNQIFEPFFTTKPSGHGLGLPICYSIIKYHQGFIEYESEENKGTKFTIFLPASPSVKEEIMPKGIGKEGINAERIGTEEKVIPPKSSDKILIMDDNKEIREMLKKFCEKLGKHVETAENGTEAIKIYKNSLERNQPFDLLILDLTIPGDIGGKDVLMTLQKIDPKVKAIIISGYSDDDSLVKFKEYGFRDAIQKPFTYSQLKTVLDKLLTK